MLAAAVAVVALAGQYLPLAVAPHRKATLAALQTTEQATVTTPQVVAAALAQSEATTPKRPVALVEAAFLTQFPVQASPTLAAAVVAHTLTAPTSEALAGLAAAVLATKTEAAPTGRLIAEAEAAGRAALVHTLEVPAGLALSSFGSRLRSLLLLALASHTHRQPLEAIRSTHLPLALTR